MSLTLAKTDEIRRASETTTAQMKLVENQTDPSSSVNVLQIKKTNTRTGGDANPKGKMTKTPTNPKNARFAEPFTTAQRKNYLRLSA